MSGLSQLHAELEEQAAAYGFESVGEAEQAGYGVDWEHAKLLEPEDAAHQAWVLQKEAILHGLMDLRTELKNELDVALINKTIEFIRHGEQ